LTTRAKDSSVFVLIFEAILPDSFVSVGDRRGDYVAAAGPLPEIEQAAAVAAKGEVGISGLGRLFADRAAEFDGTLAGHKRIADVKGQIVEVRRNIV
jgi:hypothetical protein